MASIDSLDALLVEELRDLYDAEQRLTKAIPDLVEKATNQELVGALNKHLSETRQHVARLEQAFAECGEDAKTKTCDGMKGLISEGGDQADDDYDGDSLRDAAIIGAAQKVEHYEIAAYGTAIAHARLLGEDRIVALLESTLAEEKAADQTLTNIAHAVVNMRAEDISDRSTHPRTSM